MYIRGIKMANGKSGSYTLERVTPESVGIMSASIINFLENAAQRGIKLHSFMMLRQGKVCAQGWWKPFSPEIPHHLYSFSKSVTSTAVGFAIAEGLLHLDDRIASFFPRRIGPNADSRIYSVTVEHLLTMTSGAVLANEASTILQADWVDYFLNSPLTSFPGKRFYYNSINTYMLAAILIKVTGMSLVDYLKPRLFEPLGFRNYYWAKCPMGRECGGWGLFLRTEDMAKFAQLYLEDSPLLPDGWAAQATSALADTTTDIKYSAHPDVSSGYGMQFWRNRDGKSFRADGMLGQYGIVLPELDTVIITTAEELDQLKVLDVIWDCLIPEIGLIPEGSRSGDDYTELYNLLPTLSLHKMPAGRQPEIEEMVGGHEYQFPLNNKSVLPFAARYLEGLMLPGINALRFDFEAETPTMTWLEGDEVSVIPIPLDSSFAYCKMKFLGKTYPLAVCACWHEDGASVPFLQIILRAIDTPHGMNLQIRFADNTCRLHFDEIPSYAECAGFIVDLLGPMRALSDSTIRFADILPDPFLSGRYVDENQ